MIDVSHRRSNLTDLYIISTEPAGFAMVSAETKSRRRQPTKNKTTQTNSPQWSARHSTKKPNNIDKKIVCSNLARLAGQEPSRDDASSIVWIHIICFFIFVVLQVTLRFERHCSTNKILENRAVI